MNISSIDLIDKTNNLNSFYGTNSIIEIIVNEVKKIPQHEKLSKSIDLVLHICQLIENLVYDNNIKGEANFKLDIASKVFERLGFTKQDDKDFLVGAVKFLHSSGRIKKAKIWKKVWRFVKNCAGKKE